MKTYIKRWSGCLVIAALITTLLAMHVAGSSWDPFTIRYPW